MKVQNKDVVIVGSHAMKHHFPDFPRVPADKDLIIRKSVLDDILAYEPFIDSIIDSKKWSESGLSIVIKFNHDPTPYEYLISDGQKSLELILGSLCDETNYAPISVLYSLKKAHINFPVKFDKHIRDLMFLREKLRQQKGISLETDLISEGDLLDEYPALTYLHFKETEKRIGRLKTPKMNQTTEEFFGKSKKYVKSYYVHDNMHKAIAHSESGDPIYEMFLKEGSEVETDPELWREVALQGRIWAVLEEVYVIALERKILPAIFEKNAVNYTPKQAFDWALYRVCTTLCDGFFREFAVRAYDEIQKQYNPDYVNVFFSNISKYEKIEAHDQDEDS